MTSVRERLRGPLRSWGELLLPTRCVGCGGAGTGSGPEPVCPGCTTRLVPLRGPGCPRCQHPLGPAGAACPLCAEWPAALAWSRSATRFHGPAASLIRGLKYDGWQRIVPALVRPMMRALRDGSPSGAGGLETSGREASGVPGGLPDPLRAVVPIPTTRGRLRERGFNPARVLAEGVAEALNIPVMDALSRPVEAPRQVGLPPSRRAANVRNAFVAGGILRDSLLPPHVLLVDDVLTTGATGAAAAETLARAGVERVGLLTFARAIPGDPGS